MKLRLMLVDDHAIFRESLGLFLAGQEDMEVVAEVTDGQEVLQCFTENKVDVICMDINMRRLNGIEATRQLLVQHPEAKVIGLSVHVDLSRVADMFHAGALGYVVKGSVGIALLSAIRAVGQGQIYLDPELGVKTVAELAGSRSDFGKHQGRPAQAGD